MSTCFQGFLAIRNPTGITGTCVAGGETESPGTAARETESEPRAAILSMSVHIRIYSPNGLST